MPFLDTQPAAIHRLDAGGPWARFRVTDPRQRQATLRELWRSDVPLTIGSAGGPCLPALLWSLDEAVRVLHISISPSVPPALLHGTLATSPLWAAGYLHEAKVQFELRGVTLGAPGAATMLHAAPPRQMVHLPRRRAIRVRRPGADSPVLAFRHPLAEDVVHSLRLADISLTGCALVGPTGDRLWMPRTVLSRVAVRLEADTAFEADLRIEHVTPARGSRSEVLVGCAWRGLEPSAADTLQAWIARGRRRRDLISLSPD